jgi:hypothetical protein
MNPKKKSRRYRASVSIQALDLAISRFIHSLASLTALQTLTCPLLAVSQPGVALSQPLHYKHPHSLFSFHKHSRPLQAFTAFTSTLKAWTRLLMDFKNTLMAFESMLEAFTITSQPVQAHSRPLKARSWP